MIFQTGSNRIPIMNPLGWRPEKDLALYLRARLPEAPPLPAGVTRDLAYADVERLLASVHAELGAALAVRSAFNAGLHDPARVIEWCALPRQALIRQFHSVESGLESTDADIQEYIDEQTSEADAASRSLLRATSALRETIGCADTTMDAQHASIAVLRRCTDDPAIPGGVVQYGGDERCRVLVGVVRGDKCVDGGWLQERRVSG